MPDKITDEFNRGALWFLKLMAGVVLSVLAFVLAVYLYGCSLSLASLPPRISAMQPTDAEKHWIKERMRHHGIVQFITDEATGERYFIRDGQRCKL